MQPCAFPVTLRSVFIVPIIDGKMLPAPLPSTSLVLGSRNLLPMFDNPLPFQSGWASFQLNEFWGWYMESAAGSTSYDPSTGVTQTGRFRLGGLPITGLMVRTFKNGTLHCGTAACQGNYGGSFSHRYRRSITYIGP